jgi:hypothetical protein
LKSWWESPCSKESGVDHDGEEGKESLDDVEWGIQFLVSSAVE